MSNQTREPLTARLLAALAAGNPDICLASLADSLADAEEINRVVVWARAATGEFSPSHVRPTRDPVALPVERVRSLWEHLQNTGDSFASTADVHPGNRTDSAPSHAISPWYCGSPAGRVQAGYERGDFPAVSRERSVLHMRAGSHRRGTATSTPPGGAGEGYPAPEERQEPVRVGI